MPAQVTQELAGAGHARILEDLAREALLNDLSISKTTIQSATRLAKSISCVTTAMVIPSSASCFMTLSTSPMVSGSRAEVGSSKSVRSGYIAKARAIATRCCCPPDSAEGY